MKHYEFYEEMIDNFIQEHGEMSLKEGLQLLTKQTDEMRKSLGIEVKKERFWELMESMKQTVDSGKYYFDMKKIIQNIELWASYTSYPTYLIYYLLSNIAVQTFGTPEKMYVVSEPRLKNIGVCSLNNFSNCQEEEKKTLSDCQECMIKRLEVNTRND